MGAILLSWKLTSISAWVFPQQRGRKAPFLVASWKVWKFFSQSKVMSRSSTVWSANSGGDLILTGSEPLIKIKKKGAARQIK